MGLLKKSSNAQNIPKGKNRRRRKSSLFGLSPSDVTEENLEVWRHLPSKIRHDPSMASFQAQQEKLHGNEEFEFDDKHEEDSRSENSDDDDSLDDQSEFITIKIPDQNNLTANRLSPSTCLTQHKPTSKGSSKRGSDTDEITLDASKSSDQHSTHSNSPHLSETDKFADEHDTGQNEWVKNGKIVFLVLSWLTFTAILCRSPEKVVQMRQLVVDANQTKSFYLPTLPLKSNFMLNLESVFLPGECNDTNANCLSILAQHTLEKGNVSEIVSVITEIIRVPLVHPSEYSTADVLSRRVFLDVHEEYLSGVDLDQSSVRLRLWTNSPSDLPIRLSFDSAPIDMTVGVLFSLALMILLYGLIIWELIHRTFAAVIVSTMSIAALAYLDDRPTFREIIQWIDVETLLLLFSMMILIAMMTETGIFDYLAVYSYKITGGRIWPLINSLCIVTVLISAFLDNVTTILLMTPITIRLCEVMELNPIPVLMGIIIHANIGGTMTPIGDPPNVIITTNPYILKHGITFLNFSMHMSFGVLLVIGQTFLHLRFLFRDTNDLRFKEPKIIKNLRREIRVWQRAAASITPFSKNGDLVQKTLLRKVKILKHQLKKALASSVSAERYAATLEELQKQYPIKNKSLLIKTSIVLAFILILFLLQSVPDIQHLSLAWSALIGVLLLLIITARDDMDQLMHRIEWTTLLFFASMFIITECLERLGLIKWIGMHTENIILSVSENSRLAVAIILILWISAITSAFVDSIPVTTMMVKVVATLAQTPALNLPLQPLVWALAFGPCLGGNGTLVGASANVVCAGIAEQHGYKFSFIDYLKVGFPIMIGSVVVTTAYLVVAHCVFAWH